MSGVVLRLIKSSVRLGRKGRRSYKIGASHLLYYCPRIVNSAGKIAREEDTFVGIGLERVSAKTLSLDLQRLSSTWTGLLKDLLLSGCVSCAWCVHFLFPRLADESSGFQEQRKTCDRKRSGGGMHRMLSRRVLGTDTPVMVQMQDLMRGTTDVISLAQGIVHWQPPAQALEEVKEAVQQPTISNYGADDGMPELRQALLEKLRRENNIHRSSVMVTAGANQAVVNLVLTLCDPGDSVAMFVPYYFNAYMAFQMTGVTDILLGPSDSNLHPDADWLEETLKKKEGIQVPKAVYIVNPGNPSGTYVPEPLLKRISELCREAGTWLIMDNTYEYFMYDGRHHTCFEGDHIVNVFSFSKAYGMMGWRIGYIAYPSSVEGMGAQLLKVQDNIPICASLIGQRLALASLAVGPDWVRQKVKKLGENRAMILDALSPLGEDAVKGGEGAIYLWVRLPKSVPDDVAVTKWLMNKHHVSVIPGSASGGHGYIRVSYGGLNEANCRIASTRLKKGLQELVESGLQVS